MKWCCVVFEGHYGMAGQRGYAILVGRNSSGAPEFTMQYRAVDEGQEQSLHPDVPMSTVIEVGFAYCPWCGRNALKWYGRHVDELFRPGLKIS